MRLPFTVSTAPATPAPNPAENAALRAENQALRARLEEAEETLRAIREGEVDAVIVSGSKGDRVFSLSETENLHRLMVETMNEAGLATSTDGLLLYVNNRAAALLGRPRGHLLGRSLEELVVAADVLRLRRLLDASHADTADDRVVFRAASGAEVPMHLWASRLPRSGEAVICLVGTDLTRLESDQAILNQLREHQQALKDSRAEALNLLEQALVAREQAAELARELRASDRRKDAFLATLAHELRNPLAPIRNALEILRLCEANPVASGEARAMMGRHLEHLVRLVDDLMDVSRITHGKIELLKEPLELASVIASAVETVQPLLAQSGQRLRVELPPEPVWLDGDSTRLTQIFGNLLNNAIKYTASGQTIRIGARLRPPAEIDIEVEDNGVGIPAEVLPHVFNMFAQGPGSLSQPHGGLGIGLTLVRTFVELHGGQVAAFSAGRDQGSRIQVRLPLAASARVTSAAPIHAPVRAPVRVPVPAPVQTAAPPPPDAVDGAPTAVDLAGRRILVVDDNQDAATSLAQALRLKGAETRVAFAGDAVLNSLAQARAEVVILDIDMPAPDGHEVARRIRANPAWDVIRLIAMTGLGTADVRRDSLAAGFDHHLVKPVSFEVLEALLVATPNETPNTTPGGRPSNEAPVLAGDEPPPVPSLPVPPPPVSPLPVSLLRALPATSPAGPAGLPPAPDAPAAEPANERITSLLHDLAQPLSSVRCLAMVARRLTEQAHPQGFPQGHPQDHPQGNPQGQPQDRSQDCLRSPPLHESLAGIDAQIAHASELLTQLRDLFKSPQTEANAARDNLSDQTPLNRPARNLGR
ncbi:MAG: ATP-binding protein [Halochromatium sp.]